MTDTQQPDLFGGLHSIGDRPPARRESNDVDLMHTVAANAIRCGYLLVGPAERVYTRTTADNVSRVPRYEEDAVHQLLRRRWLTPGGTHHVRCGAAALTGVALLVPKHVRATVTRWERLQRPPSWPTPPAATADGGRVVHLDQRRRRR